MSILLREFPDINWLKNQIATSFTDRRGPSAGIVLPHSSWPTVVLNAKAKSASRPDIKGPLSIFTNISGKSELKVDGRSVLIESDSYFITNAEQNYSLQIEDDTETFNIHFGTSLIEGLNSSISQVDVADLDVYRKAEIMSFHNNLNFKSPKILQIIESIVDANSENDKHQLLQDELLVELYLELVVDQTQLAKRIESLNAAKRSTRLELFQRVSMAVDYMHSYYEQDIDLDLLARISCLSKFHFLRGFKSIYNITPSRYLQNIRLKKAREWVVNSNRTLSEIAYSTGFSHLSSFSKAYHRMYLDYPSVDRQKSNLS